MKMNTELFLIIMMMTQIIRLKWIIFVKTGVIGCMTNDKVD